MVSKKLLALRIGGQFSELVLRMQNALRVIVDIAHRSPVWNGSTKVPRDPNISELVAGLPVAKGSERWGTMGNNVWEVRWKPDWEWLVGRTKKRMLPIGNTPI